MLKLSSNKSFLYSIFRKNFARNTGSKSSKSNSDSQYSQPNEKKFSESDLNIGELSREELLKNSYDTTSVSQNNKTNSGSRERKWKLNDEELKNYEQKLKQQNKKGYEVYSQKDAKNDNIFNLNKDEEFEKYFNDEKVDNLKNKTDGIYNLKSDEDNFSSNNNESKSNFTEKRTTIKSKFSQKSKLDSFLKDIDDINDSLKNSGNIFTTKFTGKTQVTDQDKTRQHMINEAYKNNDKKSLEIAQITDFLVKQPSKTFKWGVGDVSLQEQNAKEEEKRNIFNKGEYPNYLQLVKYCEICRLKDIKVYPTQELGFNHLAKHSILCTGFNPKHIHKSAKDLLREVKELKIIGLKIPSILGRRHEEMMCVNIGDISVYFFTEDGRENHDLDFIWLNKKALGEMAKMNNHNNYNELHSKKKRYKL
jgi:ribosomal silencing factor RsfS